MSPRGGGAGLQAPRVGRRAKATATLAALALCRAVVDLHATFSGGSFAARPRTPSLGARAHISERGPYAAQPRDPSPAAGAHVSERGAVAPGERLRTSDVERRACIFSGILLALASRAPLASATSGVAERPRMDPSQIAPDMQIPALPAEETLRRRTVPTDDIKDEKWFKVGEKGFKNSCSGCHLMRVGDSKQKFWQFPLTKERLEQDGYKDESQVLYIIRNGKDRTGSWDLKSGMPGFAYDCPEFSDFAVCNGALPLSERTLRDVIDYMYHRMNVGWKT